MNRDRLKQEPSGDAISREDALMCLTGEIKKTDTIETIIARFVRRIRKLPPVNPQPCEKAISRQAVLDMATTIQTDDYSGNEIIEVVDVDDVKALPPVTPQPKTGHWIQEKSVLICSICDARVARYDKYSYCPSCGAKMVEPQKRSGEE